MKKLFEQMQKIVDQHVEAYHEDFETDKNAILEMLDANNDTKYERYLFWIVRKCGTNIGYKSNAPMDVTYSYYLRENEAGEKENLYYELDLEKQTVTYIKDAEKYMREI